MKAFLLPHENLHHLKGYWSYLFVYNLNHFIVVQLKLLPFRHLNS